MDAISGIFSKIGSGISSLGSSTTPLWQKIAQLGMGGGGAIGNLIASRKRNQVLNQQLDVQKQLMNMTPDQLATGISSLEQPLSSGLTKSVGNAVQGYLAERGLSEAPGIQAETLAQGLAPYQIQEQQLATQAFLQKLGLPAQAAARFLPYPQSTDLTKLFQSLFTRPFSTSSPSGYPTTQPTLDQLNPASASTTGTYDFGSLTPPDNNGAFNWMDMLTNPGGLTPSYA